MEAKTYIKSLLEGKQLPVAVNRTYLFESFVADEQNISAVAKILENQKLLMDKWKLQNRIADINQQQVTVPNGTVGKIYQAALDFKKLGWTDIAYFEWKGFDDIGLTYDADDSCIGGVPTQSGDIKLVFRYRLDNEPEDAPLNEKIISLIINPDPKSLWKNIPSSKDDPYWKEDDVDVMDTFGDRKIVVASRRGRSHANVGSFRDDDFAYKYFDQNGWGVVAVSDGAGSARVSRIGSKIACNAIIEFFTNAMADEKFNEIDSILQEHSEAMSKETQAKITTFIYNNLGKAALFAHKKLEDFATSIECPLKDLHATLIFTLIKKYPFGNAILSFGVGDCPIGLLNKDLSAITLLNWLDVGEFGGGTRFITMPEIFNSTKFGTRFGFKLIDDFSYLMLMTDGIYDPKFVVEANLEKIGCWKDFLNDLEGENAEGVKVDLSGNSPDTAKQLSAWMNFWSPGNHDDRTLAIIY